MPNITIAKSEKNEISLLSKMVTRHGLITGATGTGKTVTIQKILEQLSSLGIPTFIADVKSDLSGISKIGSLTEKTNTQLEKNKIKNHSFKSFPTVFWDIFGKKGHPIRATISEMGPLLLSRLLELNDTQTGVLVAIFKIADDSGLLLLDIKDLKAMLSHIGENASEYRTDYGNISSATIGTIQRKLLELEQQNADQFFGEPSVQITDLITTQNGHGTINILCADELINRPKTYSTFLLWILSELYENLPEAGDLEIPKFVFCIDEAHLIFDDISETLLDKLNQVTRLIRSKGVGIFYITQNPIDIPDVITSQLGNKIQHALRAYSPKEIKAIKLVAETFPENSKLNIEKEITNLEIGEALISLLDESGKPTPTEKSYIIPPESQIGAITDSERNSIINSSIQKGKFDQAIDRESAFEKLKNKTFNKLTLQENIEAPAKNNSRSNSLIGSLAKSAARSAATHIGNSLGRQILRGILGSILGK